jgi:hypothetical protein
MTENITETSVALRCVTVTVMCVAVYTGIIFVWLGDRFLDIGPLLATNQSEYLLADNILNKAVNIQLTEDSTSRNAVPL